MKPLLLSLPDELATWRGTAAELADKCNEVLKTVPSLTDDAGAANERLVRHYVQAGVLTVPEREGREALFGLRQIVEFLATRYLLKDGWPLAKVAEIIRTTDVAGLTQLIPPEQSRTRAEEVVERYRQRRRANLDSTDDRAAVGRAKLPKAGSLPPRPDETSIAYAQAVPLEQSMPETPLALAANISRRRVSFEENLKALGNSTGKPDRSRILRITLTPWCHVDIDTRHLAEMTEDTPALLGAALRQALLEERIRRGRKP